MTSIRSFVKTTLFLLFSISSQAQERAFTSTDGRSITASLIAVSNGNVQLKTGGKQVAVPFAKFSDEDQAYIRTWVSENYPYKFDIRESEHREVLYSKPSGSPGKLTDSKSRRKRKGEELKKNEPPRDAKTKNNRGYFKIALSNRSGIDGKNLKMEYQIYSVLRYTAKGPQAGKEREDVIIEKGSLDIPHIAHTRTVTFETASVSLPDSKWETSKIVRDSDGDTDRKYTDHRRKADLHGVIVNLFDEKGRNIYSYVGPGKHMPSEK